MPSWAKYAAVNLSELSKVKITTIEKALYTPITATAKTKTDTATSIMVNPLFLNFSLYVSGFMFYVS